MEHRRVAGRRATPEPHADPASAFAEPDFERDEAAQIAPHRAISDLQKAAGPDAAFITDIGEHMLFALHYLTARGPGAFTIHLGLGSMGSGISGAVGLALGNPRRRVVCICGDGGMQMAGMEALVALEHGLPIVYAVFNDARYNMVFHGYRQVFGREAKWETGWIDFAAWAQSMGMQGVRVERPGEITAERLDQLAQARVPIVLDIRIDRDVRLSGGGRNEALQHMSMLQERHNGGRA
jgi:acetolactate synthase-1/2/3 large subunit